MKNNFEQIVKETLENFEMPYKEGAWENFDKKLSPSTPFLKSKWFIGGLVITTVAIISLSLILMPSSPITEINKQPTQLTKNTTTVDFNTPKKVSIPNNLLSNSVEKEDYKNPNIDDTTNKKTTIKNLENKKEEPTKILNQKKEFKKEKFNNKTTDVAIAENDTKKEVKETKVEEVKMKEAEMISASFFIENSICKGKLVNLVAKENNPEYKYKWSINNELTLIGNNNSYTPTKAGVDVIQLTISKDGKTIATKTSTLTVNEIPSVNIEILQNENDLINEFHFTNFDNENSIIWNFGDGESSKQSFAKHSFKKAGIYTCSFEITSPNGCSIKSEKKLDIKGYYNIKTNYGFSPNGDNLNDKFIPEELKSINQPFEMNIYSRNGKLLYTTNSIDKPWDGKKTDGSKTSFGSYVWIISLTNELGIEEVYKGTVTNVTN